MNSELVTEKETESVDAEQTVFFSVTPLPVMTIGTNAQVHFMFPVL